MLSLGRKVALAIFLNLLVPCVHSAYIYAFMPCHASIFFSDSHKDRALRECVHSSNQVVASDWQQVASLTVRISFVHSHAYAC